MKRRFILLILCAIGCISAASFFSLIFYFDPYIHPPGAIALLSLTFLFTISSFVSLLLYFFKKIYFRGQVGVYHILSSLRQASFLGLYILGLICIFTFQIPFLLPSILLLSIIVFGELFIQNL